MEKVWLETEITVDTVDWKGKAIQLPNVKALKEAITGELLVRPSEVAKAEIKQIADCFNLQPRDVRNFTYD